MHHRGVEYTVVMTAVPNVWKWQFRIGDQVKTGKTETRINLLAIRRVQLRINREFKNAERQSASFASENRSPLNANGGASLRRREPSEAGDRHTASPSAAAPLR